MSRIGDTGLWSVDGSGDATVCTDLSHRLGGRVSSSTGKG